MLENVGVANSFVDFAANTVSPSGENQNLKGTEKQTDGVDKQSERNYEDILEFTGSLKKDSQSSSKIKSGNKELSLEDKEQLEKLKRRDLEVKKHEQAHVSAGASNPQYEYEMGPDGIRYATGGHADIEVSEGNSPEETIEKAHKVKRAALAPDEPSSADRNIAAEADKLELKAKKEISERQRNGEEESDKFSGFSSVENKDSAIAKNDYSGILKGYGNDFNSSVFKGGMLDTMA